VLSTLLGSAENFVPGRIVFVKPFGDQLPVNFIRLGNSFLEKSRLLSGPFMRNEFDLFKAQPAILALLPGGACNES
jgi:hypothetical protein